MTIVLTCNCSSTYQDDRYGKSLRVHNATSKENTYRCSTCLKERGKAGMVEAKKIKDKKN